MPPITLRIRIPAGRGRTIPILVGEDLSSRLSADIARRRRGERIALIADSRLERERRLRLVSSLESRGLSVTPFALRGGERAKTRESKSRLEDQLLAQGFGRDTILVALGGGTVLDLAGFVAATFARGVPWYSMPTTLLAMVDASIGGKVAVNHPRGKNLIGAVHHPVGIHADIGWLGTLPRREIRNGMAEVVKISVSLSAPLFRYLEKRTDALMGGDAGALGDMIVRAARLKASVVERDDREEGYRQILNFGHTIGHAIETLAAGRLSHGEAVSAGTVVETRIALLCGQLDPGLTDRIVRLLDRLGLPVHPPAGLDPGRVLALTRRDKKARDGRARYALPIALGAMDPSQGWAAPVDDAVVLEAWRQSLA